jgi:tight adherence protein B
MKVKSLSSEAQATSYVLAGLPVLILLALWFIRPDHISFLFHDESGNTLLYIAAGLLSAGLISIRSMIKIDI